MTNDTPTITDKTLRPEMQKERLHETPSPEQNVRYQLAAQQQADKGRVCPHCGAVNDLEAVFCAQCGEAIGRTTCPYCGVEMDPDADFCESCRHYVRKDICSYCGHHLDGNEAFCPSCGNPRGGLVCPVCHTLNDFAFCKKCGTALTAEAKQMVVEIQKNPEYQKLREAVEEYNRLKTMLPYGSEKERIMQQKNMELCQRVLDLLAKDAGEDFSEKKAQPARRVAKDELEKLKAENIKALAEAMEKLALPPIASPVKARNYAMACKPQSVRMAWVCNYKHAMHSSPCGCAKPQLGGKWIVLGKNVSANIKDDNK